MAVSAPACHVGLLVVLGPAAAAWHDERLARRRIDFYRSRYQVAAAPPPPHTGLGADLALQLSSPGGSKHRPVHRDSNASHAGRYPQDTSLGVSEAGGTVPVVLWGEEDAGATGSGSPLDGSQSVVGGAATAVASSATGAAHLPIGTLSSTSRPAGGTVASGSHGAPPRLQQPSQHLTWDTREGKFFVFPLLLLPLLTLVRFSNGPCQHRQQDGYTAGGTCYLASECRDRGGLARGTCAAGFGVCCVFTLSCGESTDQNGTFFVNPEHPGTGLATRMCQFSIYKSSPDVTQIRLDLIQFQMAGPSEGTCDKDVFTVSGQDTNSLVPSICGQNDGQHLYLQVGGRDGPVQLRAVTSSGSTRHRWRVKVTQYGRAAPARAPPHCLQYHTGRLGSIESFNYPAVGAAGGYLNQLNYMICIRKESGLCSITYRVRRFDSIGLPQVFAIFNFRSNSAGTDVQSTVPAGQAGVGPVQCTDDYILLSADRLCGDRLNDGSVSSVLTQNADVTDNSGGQFNVKFVTGETVVSRGFKLYYRQNPCRSRRT